MDARVAGDRDEIVHPLAKVIDVLSRLVSERGAPRVLRSDNGPEFVSRALVDQVVETALIEPCKPWQNGATESFNGRSGTSALEAKGRDQNLAAPLQPCASAFKALAI